MKPDVTIKSTTSCNKFTTRKKSASFKYSGLLVCSSLPFPPRHNQARCADHYGPSQTVTYNYQISVTAPCPPLFHRVFGFFNSKLLNVTNAKYNRQFPTTILIRPFQMSFKGLQ